MAEPLLNPDDAAAGETRLVPPELYECPEPGCTEQLQLDPDSPNVLRCSFHGPMVEVEGFMRVAAEIAIERSMTIEEARAAVVRVGIAATPPRRRS